MATNRNRAQPRFWEPFRAAYNERGNNIFVLTGATSDLHWSVATENFVSAAA